MAPDRRLVDERQLEVALRICEASIKYVEQQLGLRTLRPPAGRALIRRLTHLRADLQLLEGLLSGLSTPAPPEDPTEPG